MPTRIALTAAAVALPLAAQLVGATPAGAYGGTPCGQVVAANVPCFDVGLNVDPDVTLGQDDVSMPSHIVASVVSAVTVPDTSGLTVTPTAFGSVTESGIPLDRFADPGWQRNPGYSTILPADYQGGSVTLTGHSCTPDVGSAQDPQHTQDFQGHGCVLIYLLTNEQDPNANYFVHDFQATGNAKGGYTLWRLKWRDESGKNSAGNFVYQQVRHSPGSNENFGSCGTGMASLSIYGASFSDSWPVCDAYIHAWASSTLFHSSWISNNDNGADGSSQSGQADTEGVSDWAGPESDTHGYAISDSMWWYTGCSNNPCAN